MVFEGKCTVCKATMRAKTDDDKLCECCYSGMVHIHKVVVNAKKKQ